MIISLPVFPLSLLRVFTCLLLVLFSGISFSQPGQYKFSHLNINDGLSNNQVTCIYKDKFGFMWFGTLSGLNRFDGYNIKVFRNDYKDTTSLSDNFIMDLGEDHLGRLWVFTRFGINVYDPDRELFSRNMAAVYDELGLGGDIITDVFTDKERNTWYITAGSGLYKYDVKSGQTHHIRRSENPGSLHSDSILSMAHTADNHVYFIHADGMFEKYDPVSQKVVFRDSYFVGKYPGEEVPYELYADADNDIWIYTNEVKGVFYFNAKENRFRHFTTQSPELPLSNNLVRGVVQDKQGKIWIGTDHGGINLVDKKDFSVRVITNNKEDDKSLSQNSIISMFVDNDDIIWIGTFKKGVSFYHENIIKFGLYRNRPSDPHSLSYDDVNAFAEDEKGNLWIGANGGGLIYFDRENNRFTTYKHDSADPYSLSNDVVLTLKYDKEGTLWIGTYYGGLNKFDGTRFIRYTHNPNAAGSLANDKVYAIHEDSQGNFWIGTMGGGLDLFDHKTNTFQHFNTHSANRIRSDFVSGIAEDREGTLWVTCAYGVEARDPETGEFRHYINDPRDPASLSNNNVNYAFVDSRNLVWIATREGLNLYNRQRDNFTVFRVDDGLPDNTILTVAEDDYNNLWVGTANGLSNIIVTPTGNNSYAFDFKNYDDSDGLQGREFNINAAYKTRAGEMVFGGANGFNIFKPGEIKENLTPPTVLFTDFQVFNSSVKVGQKLNGRVVLKESVTVTDEVVLKHNAKIFSIEFAALSYFHPEKNKYEYMLEGFNNEWIPADGSSRKATYTNLYPGSYTFRVKASNNDGVWNEEGKTLKITILPPFWQTGGAFILYFFIILALLLLSRKMVLDRERMRYRIEEERREARRMHEIDMMKIRFFTNISHEFRTPLMLVISPLENLLKSINDPDNKKQLTLVWRNARRMLKLVDQLLDFRKMEVEELRLNLVKGDVILFLKDIADSFSDLSEKNKISFSFKSSPDRFEMLFDHDKLEKIMFNLLSNAFKFTPESNEIAIEVSVLSKGPGADDQELEIKVKDTGIGIPKDKFDKIFDRFFQNDTPGVAVSPGSGIGLSLTREFVKLHKGIITVESEPHQGSCFTVKLPVVTPPEKSEEKPGLAALRPSIDAPHYESGMASAKPGQRRPTILLVEDNEDFRFYLKDNLRGFYDIIEASNGTDGWEKTESEIPDLVVSDIVMPGMNGIELCEKIKTDKRTSHIPVILLSAMAEEDNKLQGLGVGADDYITKPFNVEILLFRLRNMIATRDRFRKNFNKGIEVNPKEISITSLDETLIQKALDVVEQNMSNPDFSVEELSRELGMSRVHLYKKLSSLTGKSPIEFIRILRLKRAAQLLEKSQLTVAEVAYKVGFNNPKYFARYFKAEFKVLPSAYSNGKKQ